MANEEEKKLPQVYGGAYDQQINDLYGQMTNRPDFQYNVNDDALYKQYRDKYVQNAKRSMKDTMGQATSLTGGYGSTYAQGVGQQMYDENMRNLTDVIPELSDRAYQQYKDQGDQILTNFNLANTLGAADQATRQYNQEWDFQQKQYNDAAAQQAYGNLTAAILQSGYVPTEDELKAAGMTSQQANALRQAWIGSNPNLAYMTGAITADQYYQLTGQYAPGTAPAGGGGGGYGGTPKPKPTGNSSYTLQDVRDAMNAKDKNGNYYSADQVIQVLGKDANNKTSTKVAVTDKSGKVTGYTNMTLADQAKALENLRNRKDI